MSLNWWNEETGPTKDRGPGGNHSKLSVITWTFLPSSILPNAFPPAVSISPCLFPRLGSPDLEQMTSLRSSISQLSLTCDAWFGVCAFFSSSDGSIHVNHLLPAPSVPGGEDGEPSVPRFPFCPSQDEFESRPDCAAPCRNLKVAYAKSKHPSPGGSVTETETTHRDW